MDTSTLDNMAYDGLVAQYICIATLCVLIWDILVMSSDEIRLIWPSRLSLAKVLYFFNRYLPLSSACLGTYTFILSTDDSICKHTVLAAVLLSCIGHIIAESIIALRVYAIWERRWSILVPLVVISMGGAAGVLYVSYVCVTGAAAAGATMRVFSRGCLIAFPNKVDWICVTTLLLYETFMLSLLLVRTYVYFRDSNSPLMRHMYKDAIFYYVCIVATTLANLFLLRVAPTTLCTLLLIAQGVLHSILCARLLIGVRRAHEMLNPLRGHRHPSMLRLKGDIPLQIMSA